MNKKINTMSHFTEKQTDWSSGRWILHTNQIIGLLLLVLLSLDLRSGASGACEAAALQSPAGDTVKHNDKQPVAPEARSIRLPTTATPPAAQYFAQLKSASTQQSQRDAPPVDTQSLIKLLDSEDARQRARALKALAKAGPEAVEALPKLLEILRQENSYDKTLALRCVSAIGPAAAEAFPQLQSLLKDKDKQFIFRMEALRALSRIGPAGEVVIPTFLDLLTNPGELVKSYPKPGGSPAAMGLTAPMLHKGDDGRWYFDSRDENILLAIGGLHIFGAASADAIPELERVRDDPDMLPIVREGAEKAIDQIQAAVEQLESERRPASRPESKEPA